MKSWRPQAAEGVPDRLILFDGVCVFCSRWARFVIDRDRDARFCFVAVQEPLGAALAQRFGIDPAMPETNAVILGGRAYFKSDAAVAVLSSLPGWGWARVLRAVPRHLRDGLYDIVARNRYRWFGRGDTCLIPTPELAARLLRE
ncbi:MAG TPA: DCC1-like thiol-disulfide oxidoreductase family protein [Stellaceae bacterium]|jgi:predicted DCC family thiol-disulfide oxidoreductase YuxK|nr:DCC1-like thiol-disulfide oxidoreductase family protein [Stellaceae bacterium]